MHCRGLVSTDPDTIVKEGALLPLGGDERSGEQLVDIFYFDYKMFINEDLS